jgi:hypothetical protein
MAAKDIPDYLVCRAYVVSYGDTFPEQYLAQQTGQPEKVCFAAMNRAFKHGLIDYGVSLRSGWLTEAGKLLLKIQSGADVVERLLERPTKE